MVMKAVGLSLGRKKGCRPFKDYYAEWIHALKATLLPLLRRSLSDSSPAALAAHVARLHRHFLAYYAAQDGAASADVAQLLFPTWRSPLERPFLWLGDFHPFVFTNLLRAFLDQRLDVGEEGDGEEGDGPRRGYDYRTLLEVSKKHRPPEDPWPVAVAWEGSSRAVRRRLEEVERGLRLIVPEVGARARAAEEALPGRMAGDWKREGRVGEAMREHMEEMVGVFVHANRLRRGVVADLVGVMDVYQAALFLEGLAQFHVGFQDPELLAQFQRCKVNLSISDLI